MKQVGERERKLPPANAQDRGKGEEPLPCKSN